MCEETLCHGQITLNVEDSKFSLYEFEKQSISTGKV